MKGTIFISLNNMIESQYGIAFWNDILNQVQPQSEGIYTSAQDYDAAEALAIIQTISNKTDMTTSDITRCFGTELFSELNEKFPLFSTSKETLFDFLSSIEGVIHKEVRKLFPTASLPTIDCTQLHDTTLEMKYFSQNKLCFLAEGLIHGAANHYKTTIEIQHPLCMHNKHDHCILNVTQI